MNCGPIRRKNAKIRSRRSDEACRLGPELLPRENTAFFPNAPEPTSNFAPPCLTTYADFLHHKNDTAARELDSAMFNPGIRRQESWGNAYEEICRTLGYDEACDFSRGDMSPNDLTGHEIELLKRKKFQRFLKDENEAVDDFGNTSDVWDKFGRINP